MISERIKHILELVFEVRFSKTNLINYISSEINFLNTPTQICLCFGFSFLEHINYFPERILWDKFFIFIFVLHFLSFFFIPLFFGSDGSGNRRCRRW